MLGTVLVINLISISVNAETLNSQQNIASAQASSKAYAADYSAVHWYRDSAESEAIYREVYSLAAQVIKQQVTAQNLKPQQWGIVLDIDETALNNTKWDYERDAQNNQENWNTFAATGQSLPTPGIKAFIKAIHQLGGYINFVSNRSAYLQTVTEKNLKEQGMYFDQVLLDASNKGTALVDKNPRFNAIINGQAPSKLPAQKIIAWFGDNIQDFPKLYQKQMVKLDPNGKAYQNFGTHFFVLPNPIYGSWQANTFK